jgi:hypothetical protein
MKPCKHAPNSIDCSHPELIKIFNRRIKELHIEDSYYGSPCPFSPVSYSDYLRPICKYYEPVNEGNQS